MKHTNLGGQGGIADTLDLIPIGGYYGKGNRTGMFGSFLMAAYNPEKRVFESICKLGTGFTWEKLRSIDLKPLDHDAQTADRIAKEIYRVATVLKPDVWFEPKEVWEV
jgi:DNA ligase 1